MKNINKLVNALKDVIFIILFIFFVATILNFFNIDVSFNKFGTKLGNLDIIHIYDSSNLNGLVTLGIVLAILSFIYDMVFKKEK